MRANFDPPGGINKVELARLEQTIGYRFTDLRLLQRALTHASYAFEQGVTGEDNENLEFLGDAVLDLVIGHILFRGCREMREGDLTRLRAALVNEQHLAKVAREINLGDYLLLGKGENASHGRNKASILSSACEAVLGAVFEDGGYEGAEVVIDRLFSPDIESKREELLIGDAKSRLQELLQEQHNEAPTYEIDDEEGPSHLKTFTASARFRGEVLGSGRAGSKKEAEQRAAAAALQSLSSHARK